jgi:hypothetical protein
LLQLHDRGHEIHLSDDPAAVTLARDVLEQEDLACAVSAGIAVAGSDLELASKTTKVLPLRRWMPVTVPTRRDLEEDELA